MHQISMVQYCLSFTTFGSSLTPDYICVHPCAHTHTPSQLVFMTVLFYLLCYSEKDYLPVRWAMDALPHLAQGEGGGGEEYVKAFSRAIR